MNRRVFLQASGATALLQSMVGSMGMDALADEGGSLDDRLSRLQGHLDHLESEPAAPIVVQALEAQGFHAQLFSRIVSAYLVAQAMRDSTEAERRDPRWTPLLEATMAPGVGALARLLTWLKGRDDSRSQRRLIRQPRALARVGRLALFGAHRPDLETTLLHTMEGLSSVRGAALLTEVIGEFDAVAASQGTSRIELASQDAKRGPLIEKPGVVGLICFLGGFATVALGYASLGLIGVTGFFVMVAGMVLTFVGMVLMLVGVLIAIGRAIGILRQPGWGALDRALIDELEPLGVA